MPLLARAQAGDHLAYEATPGYLLAILAIVDTMRRYYSYILITALSARISTIFLAS
ncbi:uncharacterized protein K489DRAFT_382795 [Dissoconium aciculare CBS 342.82]|uniref:Uncharacterized protein n=1 Tax=Dissoconium aciculare CBS 342.82 TaxID=1314786 RepID=A0A6J3LXL4_9PEZI|nr:uncharacterized protein K489DRAFT_382795 [Dissoconium aciculare CBS 342.82]KAF1820034.1 hypothetical protein K489DRAFT_382795 [Dissoconium aciculare CBS 342.82]